MIKKHSFAGEARKILQYLRGSYEKIIFEWSWKGEEGISPNLSMLMRLQLYIFPKLHHGCSRRNPDQSFQRSCHIDTRNLISDSLKLFQIYLRLAETVQNSFKSLHGSFRLVWSFLRLLPISLELLKSSSRLFRTPWNSVRLLKIHVALFEVFRLQKTPPDVLRIVGLSQLRWIPYD